MQGAILSICKSQNFHYILAGFVAFFKVSNFKRSTTQSIRLRYEDYDMHLSETESTECEMQ